MNKRIKSYILLSALIMTFPITKCSELFQKESTREITIISSKDKTDKILNELNTYAEEYRKEKLEEERLRLEEEQRIEEERIANLSPHYNPYNLREVSNLTEEQIYQILEGNSLQTLSSAYYWMEQEYQINALFIIAITRLESSNGRSSLAISQNNLGGVKTTSGDYGYYSDWGESLNDICRLLSDEYLTEDGLFYNGESIWNINELYCEQSDWADKLNGMCNEMLNKVR